MKRILLISVLLVVAVSLTFSQIAYKQGDNVISASFGIGSSISYSGATGGVPPIVASFDYGFNENISLGGIIGYTSSQVDIIDWKYSDFIIGARGAYHYDLLHKENIDTYAGLMLAYDIASVSGSGTTGLSVGGIMFGGYAGARYFFTPELAAQLEVGYDISFLKIGVAYKL